LPYYEDSPPQKRKTSTLYYGIAKFDFIFPFVFLMVSLLAISQNSGKKKGKKTLVVGWFYRRTENTRRRRRRRRRRCGQLLRLEEGSGEVGKAGFLLSMNQTRRSFVDEALSKKNWVFSLKQVSVVN
jgi:hypothetical protein